MTPVNLRKKLYTWSGGLARLELGLATLGLVGVVVAILVQATARYLFDLGLAWPSEVSRYLYIWCSFLGGAASVHFKEEIRVDILTPLLSKLRARNPDQIVKQVQRISAFFAACFMTFLAVLAWEHVNYEKSAGLSSLILHIPTWWVSTALLVTAASAAFHYVAVMLNEPLEDEALSRGQNTPGAE